MTVAVLPFINIHTPMRAPLHSVGSTDLYQTLHQITTYRLLRHYQAVTPDRQLVGQQVIKLADSRLTGDMLAVGLAAEFGYLEGPAGRPQMG